MLTGDSTQKIEKYLISLDVQNETDDLSSTILKVGHHGSDTSSSLEFVQAVHPQVALISAGKDNMYGLPDQSTLDTFNKLGVPYLITANVGPIEYDSDGTTFVRVK
jgi:beta-lactamase superfamily II metal-dependent hydrolase